MKNGWPSTVTNFFSECGETMVDAQFGHYQTNKSSISTTITNWTFWLQVTAIYTWTREIICANDLFKNRSYSVIVLNSQVILYRSQVLVNVHLQVLQVVRLTISTRYLQVHQFMDALIDSGFLFRCNVNSPAETSTINPEYVPIIEFVSATSHMTQYDSLSHKKMRLFI